MSREEFRDAIGIISRKSNGLKGSFRVTQGGLYKLACRNSSYGLYSCEEYAREIQEYLTFKDYPEYLSKRALLPANPNTHVPDGTYWIIKDKMLKDVEWRAYQRKQERRFEMED